LPTGATQQPIRPGNTLFQRQGLHYLTEPPFKNRKGGAAKHKGALQPLLRDIAGKHFCTTGIVGYNCNVHLLHHGLKCDVHHLAFSSSGAGEDTFFGFFRGRRRNISIGGGFSMSPPLSPSNFTKSSIQTDVGKVP
jgi:hypothetical protein